LEDGNGDSSLEIGQILTIHEEIGGIDRGIDILEVDKLLFSA